MNPTQIVYISGGFLIAGTLLGSWITYRFALAISKKNNKIVAGNQLRAVFASTLAKYGLSQGKGINEIDAILKSDLPAQATAIEVFRCFVTCGKKEEYEKAWQDYHRPLGANGSIFMLEYVPSTDEPSTAKKLFNHRIHTILQFTE